MAAQSHVCDFGWKAPDFRVTGVDGKTYTLADVRGSKGTLVVFICNHCPYVKAAIARIVRDAAALKEHGVNTIAIMSNDWVAYPEDSFENMKRFAANNSLPFPYAIDETQEVARAYGAVCTPDFFGFNGALELQYRGRLDSAGMNPGVEGERELFAAMVRIAETGRGPERQTPSIGCTIKWKQAA